MGGMPEEHGRDAVPVPVPVPVPGTQTLNQPIILN